jgi:DMSO/TMAO reductase YedYZ molybdopterin-dependent catalytic subunit
MATESTAAPLRSSPRIASVSHDVAAFIAGAVAAALAVGIGELIAGFVVGAPSLVIAIGDEIIRRQPPGAKDIVVSLFGTNDKLAVNLLILVVGLVIGGLVGVGARRRWNVAVIAWLVAGVATALAALDDGLNLALVLVTVFLALGISLVAMRWLLLIGAEPAWGAARTGLGAESTLSRPDMPEAGVAQRPDRRRFLIGAAGVAVASVVAGWLGRSVLDSRAESALTAAENAAAGGSPPPSVPPAAQAALPAGASLDVAGITPIVVSNDKFYRIDTALIVPQIDVSSWSVKVDGMVAKPLTFNWQQLNALPQFEQYVTIACVSNQVGDRLVGNAKWTGVHLKDVLAMAGVQQGATQIVGRSVDNFTVGMPTEWVMQPDRDSMIALRMNDQPLPVEHGFPARLIIPGLYGYVSATKWLSEIELTTLEAYNAYWVNLGWAKEAPILTQSRIDLPRGGQTLAPGTVTIAGVAWAPDRGVSKVEISIDGGDWQTTTMSTPISDATWVQWKLDWNAQTGDHMIEVRATDGTGQVQTADQSPPAPDGARGHHTVAVTVQ